MGHGWFARPSNSIFKKINALNDDKQAWADEQQNRIDPKSQPPACVYSSTKLDVHNQITEAALMVQLANTKLVALDEHRQSSRKRRAGKAIQEGMTAFASFLESFSGVVEIVRVADEQYGGLAYGTLSFFVGVFVEKTEREEDLVGAFEDLSYAFPRMETLQSLGASKGSRTPDELKALEQLEKLLTETCALVIIFAREATQYYSSRSTRFKDTFIPERLKSGTIVQIRDHLKRVREQCDILMLAQIASLHTKLDDMSVVLHETAHWMRQSNVAASQLHESNLRKLLGIHLESMNTGSDAIDSLDSLLRISFSKRPSTGLPTESTSLDLLKVDEDFSGWWEAQNSRLLLAGGINWRPGISTGTLNWLSEGALLVIKELQEQRKKVAYYLVQSTPLIGKTHRRSLREVVANLIFQLAVMREDGFRSELDSLETLVNSLVWNGSNIDEFLEAARNLLLRIFSAFTAECQIWIVIDRLDQCSWSDDDDKDETDVRNALETLLSVISGVACCVKILITVDAPFADGFDKFGPPLSRRERECFILKPQWRQESARS